MPLETTDYLTIDNHARNVPRQYFLPRNYPQEVNLIVPGAVTVALVATGSWLKLPKKANHRFEGKFSLPAGEWHLMAQFSGEKSFRGLLSYQVH